MLATTVCIGRLLNILKDIKPRPPAEKLKILKKEVHVPWQSRRKHFLLLKNCYYFL